MSSSDATARSESGPSGSDDGVCASRRRLLGLIGLGTAAAMLGGCEGGFRPLYGSLGPGPSLEQRMAQVDIGAIPGRVGQRVRNELIFKSRGGGDLLPPVYRLEVAIRATSTTTLVTRDGTSGAQIFQLDAKFQLIKLSDKSVLLEGVSQARATFERFSNVFSNVRAADDAEDRAARTIALDIKTRIAAFLGSTT